MQIKKLSNGLMVVYVKTKQNTVAVNLTVNTGSNDEAKGIKGISHFVEHMLFEGTKKRPSSLKIAYEIETVGGEFNAFTNNERTSYYIKVPKQHFKKALEVLGDVVTNPLFLDEHIKKEKKVVMNEIGALYDDPRLYQWVMFEKTLYKKAVMRHPVIGYKEDVRSLNRAKVIGYYKKMYNPENMVLGIVGDVGEPYKKVLGYFRFKSKGKRNKRKLITEERSKERVKTENRRLNQAYMIVGYNTADINKKESIVFEVIRAVLGRGFSGKLFEEIRNKRGLAYDLGVFDESKVGYGYFAIYASIKKNSVEEVQGIIKKEIEKLKRLSAKDLEDAKRFLEGEFLMHYEENAKLANYLCFLELAKSARSYETHLKKISRISRGDVARVVKKYFKNPAIVVLR